MAINHRQGDTFWEVLGKAGKRVRVMRMPVTFPPEPFPHGELLAGLGVPDISGRIGKPFYFTSELFFEPAGGGDFKIEIVELIDNKGVIPTEIKGPPNKLFPRADGKLEYVTIPMTLTVAEDQLASGRSRSRARSSTLKAGEWSDWVRLVFPFNPILKLHGIGRFRLLSLDPEVRLYLSADPVRSREPAADPPDHLAQGLHRGAHPPLRPVQDPGLDDRHLVDARTARSTRRCSSRTSS